MHKQPIHWLNKSFNELNQHEMFDLLELRQRVFIVEQECAYPDMDATDKVARHLMAWDGETLAGCTRLIGPGITYEHASIGRVAIAQAYRGTGLGRQLMERSIAEIQQRFPAQLIKIGAQQYLEGFYNSLGFVTVSDRYLEDGIPHIDMLLTPADDV
ncbi:GNAT family N-acetyltransferase [Arenicella xantha]|uniref:ElaA protein n=1 Tax=Arenicella xantha TaxID=644221 RepID=A0A395JLD5_9GAMM|nr:GNAT family N-acetyltransferase [Arenicella xantha]RBP51603.1 ElaA protein [Arenicella xantha]